MECLDRTAKKIVDTLVDAMHCPITHICLLNHDNDHFKVYTDDNSIISKRVYEAIMKTWGVPEENISIKESPEYWWPLGSRGYIMEVKY